MSDETNLLGVVGCYGVFVDGHALPDAPTPEGDLPIEPRFQPLVDQIEMERVELGASGVSVLVMENGTITFAHRFGLKNPDGTENVDAGTLFRIGSVTKMLTATALLELVATGQVGLDDPVTRVIPGFKVAAPVGAEATITVRHLLDAHTIPHDEFSVEESAERLRAEWVAHRCEAAHSSCGFGATCSGPLSWRPDHLSPHLLDLDDFVPATELALDQLGRRASLEQGASCRIVPRIDVIRDVVIEDEPSAREHAADDQIASRILRVCETAQQFLGLRRSQIRHAARCLATLRFPAQGHAP